MVVGFNHNFRYRGEVYHIQTEDSGVKSPNIVSLLYQGGTILASKKTSYADISKVDNLDKVVEELMKEQHKGMLRSLKSGEFDTVIERFKSGKTMTSQVLAGEKPSKPQVEVAPVEDGQVAAAQPAVEQSPAPASVPPVVAAEKPPSSVVAVSLDEVILSYLMGDDK
jgi:hypothetical protein